MRRRGRADGSIRVTIGQVAALARVSTATVSRALTRPESVGAARLGRVRDAAAKLGFEPNAAARALSSQRSGLIGILVPALAPHPLGDAVAAALLTFSDAGLDTLVAATGGDADASAGAVRRILLRDVEGLLVFGAQVPALAIATWREQRIRWLVHTHDLTQDAGARCGIDYRQAGAIVGQFLVGQGHRRCAFLAGPDMAGGAQSLREGLRAALATVDGATVACASEGSSSSGDSVPSIVSCWLGDEVPPTAIVCSDDLTALAAARACQAMRVPVPGAVSIVGCGDAPFARLARPSLTTLRVPGGAWGRSAAEMLLGMRAGATPATSLLACKLVVRGSTAAVA